MPPQRHGQPREDQPAGHGDRDGPGAAHRERALALVDEVALGEPRIGDLCLYQVGAVPGAALDLPAPLVIRIEKDREVQRDQTDPDERAAETEKKPTAVRHSTSCK